MTTKSDVRGFAEHASASDAPYVAVFCMAADVGPPGKLQYYDIKGLLCLQTLSANREPTANGVPASPIVIYTFWRSRDSFDTFQSALLAKLKVFDPQVKLRFAGPQLHFQLTERPMPGWKRPQTWWAWFVAFVAALGTAEAARQHHDWLAGWPRIAAVGAGKETNLLIDEPTSHPVQLRNLTRGADSDIVVDSITLVDANDRKRSWNVAVSPTATFPKVEPGDIGEFSIDFPVAVNTKESPFVPGDYLLYVRGRQKSGLIWHLPVIDRLRIGDFNREAARLTIWPSLKLEHRKPLIGASKRRVIAEFLYQVGAENSGLDATVTMHDPHVTIGHSMPRINKHPSPRLYVDPPGGSDGQYSGIKIRTPPISAFRRYKLDIELRASKDLTVEEWKDAVNQLNIQVDFLDPNRLTAG